MRSLLLCLVLLSPARALAADDDPIPYSDDPGDRTPRTSRPEAPPEPQYELEDQERRYYRQDDPYIGLGAELLGALVLLDSSQGALIEPSAGFGVRGVWEFGRLLSSDLLRNALFADVTWLYTGLRQGTESTFAATRYHYFTFAPAWQFRFSEDSPFGIYLQLGGGLSLLSATLTNSNASTSVTGLKPLFQYGAGFRFAPKVSGDGTYRLAFRLELTRFRRGYMDDTVIALSGGLVF